MRLRLLSTVLANPLLGLHRPIRGFPDGSANF